MMLHAVARHVAARLHAGMVWAVLALVTTQAVAQLPQVAVHPSLLNVIQAMPEGSWAKVNQNAFSEVWPPEELRTLFGSAPQTPHKIVTAWSGFGWDTARGDIILYGGGHANYSGNDVYRWRSSTLRWERAALSSEMQLVPGTAARMAIDGADAAPASAHTYDNNIYLPVVDRLLAIGGALYDSGGGYVRPDELNPATFRHTGPYLYNPALADPNKVGGTTGSHVQRVAPHPEIVGGNMWQNRDLPRFLSGQPMPVFFNGCTAHAAEGGRDVVYMLGMTGGSTNQDLYRYEIVDVNAPSLDRFSKVGMYFGGPAGVTTACAMDADARLFVRTGTATQPFAFFDLTQPSPTNPDRVVQTNASISGFMTWLAGAGVNMSGCGMEFDPIRKQFVLWCGNAGVWSLKAPTSNVTSGWTMAQQSATGTTTPVLGPGVEGGVLGKWRYAPGYDVFVALATATEGEVWVYKPVGWQAPGTTNQLPSASVTGPAPGTSVLLGNAITLTATASDADGSISKVEFLANGTVVGQALAAPYTVVWTPAAAAVYSITARATDNAGGIGLSAPVQVSVVAPVNTPPTVSLTAPTAGASFPLGSQIGLSATAADADGQVAQVEFLANGVVIGQDSAAPYAAAWTPGSAGAYSLVARAVDNAGATTSTAAVPITVTSSGTGTPATITLQRGLNGYSGAADTTLSSFSFQTTTNYGTRASLTEYLKGYTNLIRFAVFQSEGGPVPNGATIQSARLEIYKEVYNYTYRLHPLLKPWEELQATWINARSGSAWASPGASGAGTDYSTTPDAQITVSWDAGWMNFDVTAAAQAMSAGRPNFGWRLVGVSGYDGSIRYFRSSDHATASFRPKMTITYVADGTPPPPPAPPAIGFGSATAVGSVSDTSITSVRVNGVATPVSAGQFSFTLPLTSGTRNVTIEATNAGGTTTRTITVTVP